MKLFTIFYLSLFAFAFLLLIYSIRVNHREGNYGWVLIYVFILLGMVATVAKVMT